MNSNLSPTTIDSWLQNSTALLKSAHIETARLDCLVLLADELHVDKSYILARPEIVLQIETVKILNTKIIQRSLGTPLAYVRGTTEFYGREFFVNSDVLVPRPDSESIIELLEELPITAETTILDIGTGSGCLGISAAFETAITSVSLLDIDPKALNVAERNMAKHHINATLIQSDLLTDILYPHDIYLANLPYVPSQYEINYAAKFEPSIALFAGEDGLDAFRQLFAQMQQRQLEPSYLITESLEIQHTALRKLAEQYGFQLQAVKLLAQAFKFIRN